jgi:glycosyltransferase involved in cell wall biosynthesis
MMISIIIPCFNAERTLERTLLAALSQDVDKEIIVVDDGSTDRSAALARRFEPNVRCMSTTNRGVSAARNLGTQVAKGAFLQFLDSDDVLMKQTLADRRRVLDETGADVAFTDWEKIDEADRVISEWPTSPVLPEACADAEIAIATSRFWAPPGAFLYRRAITDRTVGWNTDLVVVQDVRFLLDVARAGAAFVHVPMVGVRYRVRADSLSQRSSAGFIADCARFARQMEGIWCAPGPATSGQRRALADMWAHVATTSLVNGFNEFEEAVASYNRFSRRDPRFEIGRLLRRVLDAEASGTVAKRYMALKAALARKPAHPVRE